MRGLFVFIIAIGLFGAVVGNGLSRSQSSGNEILQRAEQKQESDNLQTVAQAEEVRRPDGAVALDRASDGHFYADVQVNGAMLHMLVDTGATGIALSREDARSAGIATSIGMPEVVGQGADGDVHGEIASLDRVSLGRKTVEGLPAIVLNSGEQSLLGQSFLSKFEKVSIEGDKMFLE
jgi:aspartyl protease family protein